MTTLRFYQITDGELVELKVHENLHGYSIDYNNWPNGTFCVSYDDDNPFGPPAQLSGMFNNTTEICVTPQRYILEHADGNKYVIQVNNDYAELIPIDGRTMDVVYGILGMLAFNTTKDDIERLVDVSLRKGVEGVIHEIKMDTYKVLDGLPE